MSASASAGCWDVEKTGFCPRRFCNWCGTATQPAGAGKGTGKDASKGKGKGKYSSGGAKWSGSWSGGSSEDMQDWMWTMMEEMKGKGKGKKGWQQAPKKEFKVDDAGGVLGEFIGTIKKFDDWKSYGFIECDEVKQSGYGDIFLHGDEKKGYKVGHQVKFECYLTSEGKPQARSLKSGLGASSGSAAAPAAKEKHQVDDAGGVLGEFLGTIKKFDDWKNYGFIECDEVKQSGYGDVFLHGDEKKGYRAGHTVKFECYLTSQGKPQARNLKSGLK